MSFKKYVNDPLIVGADIGKTLAKITTDFGTDIFSSYLYPYRELNLKNKYGQYDFEVEFEGELYLGGDLGKREGEIPLFNSDTSKNYTETLIVLLSALSMYETDVFKIVMGAPIIQKDKKSIVERFKKSHIIKINGVQRNINIQELEIGPEGAASFWNNPKDGLVRGLDFGSTTTNIYSIFNRMYIDKESDTFPYGVKTSKTDIKDTVRSIHSNLKNIWNEKDYVEVLGGHGEEAIDYVKEYYPNAVLIPDFLTATSKGLYELARANYEETVE